MRVRFRSLIYQCEDPGSWNQQNLEPLWQQARREATYANDESAQALLKKAEFVKFQCPIGEDVEWIERACLDKRWDHLAGVWGVSEAERMVENYHSAHAAVALITECPAAEPKDVVITVRFIGSHPDPREELADRLEIEGLQPTKRSESK